MYVMYKTVLAGREGAEWGTERDWVSCLIPKLALPWRGTWRTFARWIPLRRYRRNGGSRRGRRVRLVPASTRRALGARGHQNLILRTHAKLGLSDAEGNPRDPQAPVTVWGTGTPRREFLYADDAGEAVCFLLERLLGGEDLPANLPDGMINIGVGEDLTVSELARLVQRIVGHEGEIKWDSSQPDGTPQKLMDVSRMNKLGWKPRVSLKEGIRRTYEWYCAAGS